MNVPVLPSFYTPYHNTFQLKCNIIIIILMPNSRKGMWSKTFKLKIFTNPMYSVQNVIGIYFSKKIHVYSLSIIGWAWKSNPMKNRYNQIFSTNFNNPIIFSPHICITYLYCEYVLWHRRNIFNISCACHRMLFIIICFIGLRIAKKILQQKIFFWSPLPQQSIQVILIGPIWNGS